MDNKETEELASLTLAPYLQKAYALVGSKRKVGGNQFRHMMATLAILIDYHYIDPILLKASVIHDLIEDYPEEANYYDLSQIDNDGPLVLNLVLEVTHRKENNNSKEEYLKIIRDFGTVKAKTLKIADRISNLTDLNLDTFSKEYIRCYINQTETYILPMALAINKNMANELSDLIKRKRKLINDSAWLKYYKR